MWRSLLLLWSVPATVTLLIVSWRVAKAPSLGEKAWRLAWRESESTQEMSALWLAAAISPMALLLFILGVLQGLVFANLGLAGAVLMPMAIGAGAMALLGPWIRFASRLRTDRNPVHTGASVRSTNTILHR
jgi:hypothetical protein